MIETERLILRRWEERDRATFHAHCSDPEVMRYLGPLQSREETDAQLDRQNGYIDAHGFCFWAVERRTDAALIGFCGLKPGAAGTPIEHEIEIGWRLGRDYWRQGFAHEAARASLDWAWANLDAPRVAAITSPDNAASRRLMERVGMTRDPAGDFDHPAVPADSPLVRHITYRIARPRG